MRLPVIALVLSTYSLAGCAKPDAPRIAVVTPDPAKLASCPATFPAAPSIAPLSSFTLPDGRAVVLLSTVIAREKATVEYILLGRASFHACRSSVAYVQDWSKALGN
jgi:hypothetical protein